jgi:RNA polymerase sigma-70 factor (ECF subfamily)
MPAGQQVAGYVVESHDDLAERIARGDPDAEAEFARRYSRGVRVLIRRHARTDDTQVDDLAQDVLSGVLRQLRAGAVRDAKALAAYVRSAAVRAATAASSRERNRSFEELSTADVATTTEIDGPERTVERFSLAALVRTVLAELPSPRDRNVLALFYLEDLSKDEVCLRLGIDAEHFRRVMHRARERMRLLLAERGVLGGGR